MGRLQTAVTAICGAVVGFLLGLLVAMLIDSPAQQTAERERLETELRQAETEATADIETVLDDLAEVEDERDALLAKVDALPVDPSGQKLEREIAAHEQVISHWFSTQAVLGMLIKHPETRPLIFSPSFTENYKAPWYLPEVAFEAIGARWLAEDMIAQGILDKSFLEFADAQNERLADSNTGTWTVLKRWTTGNEKTTESFRVASPLWRISWRSDPEWGVTFSVYRDDGSNDGEGQYISGVGGGMGTDSSFVRTVPGIFYLDIHPAGGELAAFAPTITVEVPAN